MTEGVGVKQLFAAAATATAVCDVPYHKRVSRTYAITRRESVKCIDSAPSLGVYYFCR